jgi:hypothetical protein
VESWCWGGCERTWLEVSVVFGKWVVLVGWLVDWLVDDGYNICRGVYMYT